MWKCKTLFEELDSKGLRSTNYVLINTFKLKTYVVHYSKFETSGDRPEGVLKFFYYTVVPWVFSLENAGTTYLHEGMYTWHTY